MTVVPTLVLLLLALPTYLVPRASGRTPTFLDGFAEYVVFFLGGITGLPSVIVVAVVAVAARTRRRTWCAITGAVATVGANYVVMPILAVTLLAVPFLCAGAAYGVLTAIWIERRGPLGPRLNASDATATRGRDETAPIP